MAATRWLLPSSNHRNDEVMVFLSIGGDLCQPIYANMGGVSGNNELPNVRVLVEFSSERGSLTFSSIEAVNFSKHTSLLAIEGLILPLLLKAELFILWRR